MIEFIVANKENILLLITGVVSVASIIVKLTPTPKDDEVFSKVYKVLESLSLAKKS